MRFGDGRRKRGRDPMEYPRYISQQKDLYKPVKTGRDRPDRFRWNGYHSVLCGI